MTYPLPHPRPSPAPPRALPFLAGLLALLALLVPGPRANAGPGDQPPTTLETIRRADGPPVQISIASSTTTAKPGDQFVIAIIFDQAPGWHIQTNDPKLPQEWEGQFQAFATEIKPTPIPGLKFGPIQWPKIHEVMLDLAALGHKLPFGVFEGRAVAFIPVVVENDDTPGERTIPLVVSYQACNDRTCLFPTDEPFEVRLTIIDPASSTPSAATPDPIFAEFDPAVFSRMKAGEVLQTPTKTAVSATAIKFNFFGRSFSIDTAGAGLALLLILAAAGGLLLNFTPCVLPVLPLKIMGLSQSAGNARRCAYLGFVMSLGTVFFWLVIGSAIAFISSFKAINQLFQFPLFSLGVGLFIAIMAIGMLGLFTVQLPKFVYFINPKQESTQGSFLFGIMTAILSTPCTAPFMGTAAAWAAKQPPAITLITFAAIGAGMALPYLVLSANPKLIAKIPRTGPASELIKQVMGLLMIAVAVFFIGTGLDPLFRKPIDPPMRFFWWIIAAVIVIAMGWLVLRTFQITKSPGRRLAWSLAALLLAGSSIPLAARFADHGPIAWIPYTPENFAQAQAEHRVIVMDFTAEWCANCKILEASVLHRANIVKLLKEPGVTPMKVDLTGDNTAGNSKLKELNWIGIPLLAIYGPGLQEPLKYDSYTVQTVVDAIGQARGPAVPKLASTAGQTVGQAPAVIAAELPQPALAVPARSPVQSPAPR